jgi:hypothetical protein
VTAHLIAVQAAMRLENYRDAESFRAYVVALAERAVAGLDGAPKLIAFPETMGLPLLLTLRPWGSDYDCIASSRNVSEAGRRLLQKHWHAVLKTAWRFRAFGPQAFFLARALPAYRAYTAAFAEAARRTGATVVAGSSFLPPIATETARGTHVAEGRVYNVAYTFAPTGTLLDQTAKRYLTLGLESHLGLSRASPEAQRAFETPVGRVGVAVCLDGFYSSVVDRFDALGAQIIVQPSANFAPWTRPWPPDRSVTEGEAWLAWGLRAHLQGRLHLRYGLNPMLVGELFDLRARGRTSIVCNPRYHEAETEGYRGVLKLAETDDGEEIVRVAVPLF